jgi:hypothetical protein
MLGPFKKSNRTNTVDFRYGGRFSLAWLQSSRHSVPARHSTHAPTASLSVQKTSAIPADVVAFM